MNELKTVCQNPWCKATFFYLEEDMVIPEENNELSRKINKIVEEKSEKIPPRFCKKCISFEKELSGGIEWKTKTYEGDRFDGMPHQIKYKVTNYR